MGDIHDTATAFTADNVTQFPTPGRKLQAALKLARHGRRVSRSFRTIKRRCYLATGASWHRQTRHRSARTGRKIRTPISECLPTT